MDNNFYVNSVFNFIMRHCQAIFSSVVVVCVDLSSYLGFFRVYFGFHLGPYSITLTQQKLLKLIVIE